MTRIYLIFIIMGVLLCTLFIGTVIGKQRVEAAVSVSKFIENPSAFTGTVSVAGVISEIAAEEPRLFALMDIAESKCPTPGCRKPTIPVMSSIKPPKIGTKIVITGNVEPGGRYFAADRLRRAGWF